MKQKLKRNKGITLIALILTIIVLLILAVVAINAVKGDGIIAHAKNAKADYTKAQANEQDVLSGYELMLAEETGNAWKQEKTKVTKGDTTLNVGDTITNFTAGGKTWKVLGTENGKLLLTTTENVNDSFQVKESTSGWSETEKRFVDAEKALDEECKSKITLTESEKKQVAELRSIKVEDINRVTGYDPKTAENGKPYGVGEIYQYGNEVTYSVVKNASGTVTGVKYESKNVANKSGTSTWTRFLAPNTSTDITGPYTVISTSYEYDIDSETDLKKGSDAYKLIESDIGYWLVSSAVVPKEGVAEFGMHAINSGKVQMYSDFWESEGGWCGSGTGVRPVVSLKSDVELTKNAQGDWNIK